MLPLDLRNLIQEFVTPSRTVEVMMFVSANREAYTRINASRHIDTFDELSVWRKLVTITNLEIVHRKGLTLWFNPMRYYARFFTRHFTTCAMWTVYFVYMHLFFIRLFQLLK